MATSAQTTSGWVLWEMTMVTKAGADSVTWVPLDGFESIAECRQTGQQMLQNALDYVKSGAGKLLGPVRPDGRSLIYEVTNAKPRQTVDTRFLCFPGALDPRARQAPTPSPKR
ncbi:MAG TPA: hypothetical protein VGQ37_12385 [Vicinamibacterales bacterium]|nr:hypothetical protein [Vicinamibacterales bacterium]